MVFILFIYLIGMITLFNSDILEELSQREPLRTGQIVALVLIIPFLPWVAIVEAVLDYVFPDDY